MESFEIRLTNLSWQATEQDIQDFVNSFAKCSEVKLVLDFKKRSRGLAYVKLADQKSLDLALQAVERTHMDRSIKIIRAKPLSEKQNERKAQSGVATEGRSDVRKNSGQKREPRAPRAERTGQRGERRNAPKEEAERKDAPKTEHKTSGDQKRRVYKPKHNDDNSIYVGNLSFKTTEMKLGRHFEKYGEIKDVRIVEDEKERSRGFGYVEFEQSSNVEKAIQADGSELDGRKIRVAKVQKRERKNISESQGQKNKKE